MPLITYRCRACQKTKEKLFRVAKDIPSAIDCECGSQFTRSLGSPASTSKIVVDNGQARAVEIHPEINELRQEWSKPPNRGD